MRPRRGQKQAPWGPRCGTQYRDPGSGAPRAPQRLVKSSVSSQISKMMQMEVLGPCSPNRGARGGHVGGTSAPRSPGPGLTARPQAHGPADLGRRAAVCVCKCPTAAALTGASGVPVASVLRPVASDAATGGSWAAGASPLGARISFLVASMSPRGASWF